MTLPDDVVERVARALDSDAWRIADEAGGYDKARGIRRALDYSLSKARAALEAARYGELVEGLRKIAAYREYEYGSTGFRGSTARALLSSIGAA